jgi:hypothetical protein
VTELAADKFIGRTTSLAASGVRRILIAMLRKNFCALRSTQEFFTAIRFRSPTLRTVAAFEFSTFFGNAFGNRVQRHLACNPACL